MTTYADTQYGSKVIASDRSNYWRYYGLHRDPFMPIVEDNNFFLPARWEQYFDLLQYLCESTNVLLSVVGVKGSGKTTFMRQFVAQASDTAKICRLVGSTVLTAAQLSKTLIKDFNLPKPTGETTEEQWESLCHNLQSGTQPYLLVIDDAHRLSQETLKVILNLIKQQSEHQMRLHVLLIGEIQLTNMLNALKEGEADRELIHTITLESLNLQDTEAYIKHRLVAAGLPGGMPLRPTDIGRIYKLSEGVPGRINAVARQVLIDVMQQRQLYGFAHFIRTRRTQLLGGTIILAVLLVLAAILTRGAHDPAFRLYKILATQKTALPTTSDTHNTISASSNASKINKAMVMPTAIISKAETQTMLPTSATPLATVTTTNTTSNIVNAHKALATPATLKPTTINSAETIKLNTGNKVNVASNQWYSSGMLEFKAPAAKHSEKTTTQYKTTTATASNTTLQQQQANTNSSALSTATPTTMNATVATTTPTTITPAKPATTATAAAISDKLLTPDSPIFSNPKHYTLQLVGVSSESVVDKFINKNQLSDQAYYYHTHFRNKDWYVIVYGDYPTRKAAQDALATLPEGVANLNPWPRSMASVLKSVRHGQTNNQGLTAAQAATAVQPVSLEANTKMVAPEEAKGTATKNTQDDGVNVPLTQ